MSIVPLFIALVLGIWHTARFYFTVRSELKRLNIIICHSKNNLEIYNSKPEDVLIKAIDPLHKIRTLCKTPYNVYSLFPAYKTFMCRVVEKIEKRQLLLNLVDFTEEDDKKLGRFYSDILSCDKLYFYSLVGLSKSPCGSRVHEARALDNKEYIYGDSGYLSEWLDPPHPKGDVPSKEPENGE